MNSNTKKLLSALKSRGLEVELVEPGQIPTVCGEPVPERHEVYAILGNPQADEADLMDGLIEAIDRRYVTNITIREVEITRGEDKAFIYTTVGSVKNAKGK